MKRSGNSSGSGTAPASWRLACATALLLLMMAPSAHPKAISIIHPGGALTLFTTPSIGGSYRWLTAGSHRTITVPVSMDIPYRWCGFTLSLKLEYPHYRNYPLDLAWQGQVTGTVLKHPHDRISELKKSKKKKRKYALEKDFLYLKPKINNLFMGQEWDLARTARHKLDRRRDLRLVLDTFKYWNGQFLMGDPAMLQTRVRSVSLHVVYSGTHPGWRYSLALGGGVHDVGLRYHFFALDRIYQRSGSVLTGEVIWKVERVKPGDDYFAFEIRSITGDKAINVDSLNTSVLVDFNNTYCGVAYNFYVPIEKIEKMLDVKKIEKILHVKKIEKILHVKKIENMLENIDLKRPW